MHCYNLFKRLKSQNCKLLFNLDSLAMKIIVFVKINRLDLAEVALRQLKTIDEDNCLA